MPRETRLQAAGSEGVLQAMRLILQSRRYAFTDELGLGLKVRIEGPVRQPGVTHDSGESGSSDAVTAKAFGRHLHDPAARCIFPALFVTHGFPFLRACQIFGPVRLHYGHYIII